MKKYDRLIAKLRWEGKPKKWRFKMPWPWMPWRIFQNPCNMTGDHCGIDHTKGWKDVIVPLIIQPVVIIPLAIVFIVLQPKGHLVFTILATVSLFVGYICIYFFGLSCWLSHRESLRKMVEEIETANAKEVVASYLLEELNRSRDTVLGESNGSLKQLVRQLDERIGLLSQSNASSDDEVQGENYRIFSRIAIQPKTRLERVKQSLERRRNGAATQLAIVEKAFAALEGEITSIGESVAEAEMIEASAKLDPSLAGELAEAKTFAFSHIANFTREVKRLSESAIIKNVARFEEEDGAPTPSQARIEDCADNESESEAPPRSSKRKMVI